MPITNSGVAEAAAALLARNPSYIGLGSSNAAESGTAGALAAEIGLDGNPGTARGALGGSLVLGTTTIPNDTLMVAQAFTSVAAEPFTIAEIGLFDASGVLLSREVLATPRSLVPGGVMQVRVNWQMAII